MILSRLALKTIPFFSSAKHGQIGWLWVQVLGAEKSRVLNFGVALESACTSAACVTKNKLAGSPDLRFLRLAQCGDARL